MCACCRDGLCPACAAEMEREEWPETPQDRVDVLNMLAGVPSNWFAGTVCDDA